MNKTEIRVYENMASLASAAADTFAEIISCKAASGQSINIALSGGKTPAAIHESIVMRYPDLPWSNVRIFMGDERIVPYSDKDSNYGMAIRTLIDHVDIPSGNLFPMPTSGGSDDDLARDYASTLEHTVPKNADGIPSFDLVLLGLGEDGHTASLFPGKPSVEEQQRLCISTTPGTLPPPINRLSFTFPVINAARNVVFVASGEAKANVLATILKSGVASVSHPASLVLPKDGNLIWMLDKAAASKLD